MKKHSIESKASGFDDTEKYSLDNINFEDFSGFEFKGNTASFSVTDQADDWTSYSAMYELEKLDNGKFHLSGFDTGQEEDFDDVDDFIEWFNEEIDDDGYDDDDFIEYDWEHKSVKEVIDVDCNAHRGTLDH